MTATRETILQTARSVCKAIAGTSALTDAQVRVWDDPGPRPSSAYLAVNVQDVRGLGYDEKIPKLATGGAALDYTGRGARAASVSIHGFGSGADEWLENIRSRLALDAARLILDAAAVDLCNPGTVIYAPTRREQAIEQHWILDLEASFIQKVVETVPFAVTSTVNTTLHDDLSNFTTSQTISLTP